MNSIEGSGGEARFTIKDCIAFVIALLQTHLLPLILTALIVLILTIALAILLS